VIEIIGDKDSSEYSAAISIAKALEELWPAITESDPSEEHVKIAVGVKLSGYKISDIDLVICAVFGRRKRRFIASKDLTTIDGMRVKGKPILVHNFVLAVEVKDHDADKVKVSGDNVSVFYSRGAKRGWKSATDQNINQVHSLTHYFKDSGQNVYVHRCLFMRGMNRVDSADSIAANFEAKDFLTSISLTSKVYSSRHGYSLSSGNNSGVGKALNASIFRSIKPTSIDRNRMDMIGNESNESDALIKYCGKKMVTLRGHSGSGKTIMLLRMAVRAYRETGTRTLLLTYNHALAADIRRLLSLLRIPSDPDEGGIMIRTVMSFMYSWFQELKDQDEYKVPYEQYIRNCKEIAEQFVLGVLSDDYIKNIIDSDPDQFDFDCIIVDESQDWPQEEVDLLKLMYSPKTMVLGDGIDQLLRQKMRPNWYRGEAGSDRHIVTLNSCLRMKRNLTFFTNQMALLGGVYRKIKENEEGVGGKIIVMTKPYVDYGELHERLISNAKDSGNVELDFLFCVPPSSVHDVNLRKKSNIGNYLLDAGYEVWDGVDDLSRKDFPRSRKQYRVVQYASCRGLEGWTVVLEKVDLYWEDCKSLKIKEGLTPSEELAYEDLNELSEREAWLHVLIALTRAIDTLVINLGDAESHFSKRVFKLAKKHPDFVEIIN
jgi:hypothetical protein